MAQTRDQIQLSFGRLVDWMTLNPLLLPGEVACVFDNETMKPIDLKFGNGISRFSELPSLVNNDIVYTKNEVDVLFSKVAEQIGDIVEKQLLTSTDLAQLKTVTIPAIQDLFDPEAADTNKLVSVSTMLSQIKNSINTRFGRKLTFTPTGAKFSKESDLNIGPWYADGEIQPEPIEGDLAEVEGIDYDFKFTITGWVPNVSKLLLEDRQWDALNSGVTSQTVEDLATVKDTVAVHDEDIETAKQDIAKNARNLSDIDTIAAKKYSGVYSNKATVTSGGAGYSLYDKCSVNGASGFITKVSNSGSIVEVFLCDTLIDITGDDIEIVAQGGTGAAASVVSTSKIYDLSTSDAYLKQLIELSSNYNLPRGLTDNKLQMVRNGQLTAVFTPETIKYVDASYTGKEEGLEFAPFTTVSSAIRALSDTAPGTLVLATGHYDETLNLVSKLKKNIIGYAISSQNGTSINRIQIDRNSENIGLRDLRIIQLLEFAGSGLVSCDNLTIDGQTSISTRDVISFAHCTFNGEVVVNTGSVEFDCCTFGPSSTLVVKQGASVVVRECVDITPDVLLGGTYIQLSGSCRAKNGRRFAVSASSDAAFIGLFDGISLSESNDYAPISIAGGANYVLGSFLFDSENSEIASTAKRKPYDGLSSLQIRVGKRTGENEGYTSQSQYLKDHLNEISKILARVSHQIVAGAIDGVELVPGSKPGSLKVQTLSGGLIIDTSEEVEIPGLGTAAFTPASSYATAAQGALAATAYQFPEGGIPISQLSQQLQQKLEEAQLKSNKSTTINEDSTNDTYPTTRAIYLQLMRPFEDVVRRIPQATGNLEKDMLASIQDVKDQILNNSGRLITATEFSTGTNKDAFASIKVLNTEGTEFFYGGQSVPKSLLREGDKAMYFRYVDSSGNPAEAEGDGIIQVQSQAIYINGKWTWFSDMSQELTQNQRNALNSGITLPHVQKLTGPLASGTADSSANKSSILSLEKSVAEEINDRQRLLDGSASLAGSIVTHGGSNGTWGAPRTVVNEITRDKVFVGVDDPSGSHYVGSGSTGAELSRDIPTAKSVSDLIDKTTREISRLLATKQPNLPVGSDNESGWYRVESDGTIAFYNDSNMRTAIETILGDNGKYLTVDKATKNYTLNKKQTEGASGNVKYRIVGTPTTDNTNEPTYFDFFNDNIGNVDKESHPAMQEDTSFRYLATVKAVRDSLDSLADQMGEEFRNFAKQKQEVLAKKVHDVDVLCAPSEVGGPPSPVEVKSSLVTKIEDGNTVYDSAATQLVTSGGVAKAVNSLLAADTEMSEAVFGSLSDKSIPAFSSSTNSFVNSGLSTDALVKLFKYEPVASWVCPINSFTTYERTDNPSASSAISSVSCSISKNFYSNVSCVPIVRESSPFGICSYFKPVSLPTGGVTFTNSVIALDLSQENLVFDMTFVNSVVYIYKTSGTAFNDNSKFTFRGSKVYISLTDPSSANVDYKDIKVLSYDSEIHLGLASNLVFSTSTTNNTTIYLESANSKVSLASGTANNLNSTIKVIYSSEATNKPTISSAASLPYIVEFSNGSTVYTNAKSSGNYYGTCSTAAATAVKVVTCPDFVKAAGAKILVKFVAANTANNVQLNVNSTGAVPVKYRTSTQPRLTANGVYEFVYGGESDNFYYLVGDIDTTYSRATDTSLGLVKSSSYGLITNTDNAYRVFVSVDGTMSVQINKADYNSFGLVKLATDELQSGYNEPTSVADKTYPIQLDDTDQVLVVNVPWTDTKYTLPKATNSVRGGIKLGNNTVQTAAISTPTSKANRTYPVQLDSNERAVVNVPWENSTNFVPTTGGTFTGAIKAAGLSTTVSGTGISNAVISTAVATADIQSNKVYIGCSFTAFAPTTTNITNTTFIRCTFSAIVLNSSTASGYYSGVKFIDCTISSMKGGNTVQDIQIYNSTVTVPASSSLCVSVIDNSTLLCDTTSSISVYTRLSNNNLRLKTVGATGVPQSLVLGGMVYNNRFNFSDTSFRPSVSASTAVFGNFNGVSIW